jgi:endo-1,4-beta-mannosidase
MYEMLSDGSSTRGCGDDLQDGAGLNNALSSLGTPGNSGAGQVLRVWFFQRFSVNGSARDWTYFDRALAAARAHGFRVIAVLGNEWTECDDPSALPSVNWTAGGRSATWFQSGYRDTADSGLLSSYRQWVQEVVSRYQGNPTIALWQLMNEAQSDPAPDGTSGVTLLRSFADDVGGLIKSIDHNHLVSFGTIGTGQPGTANADYQTVYASPSIDVAEVHDYSTAGTTLAGDQWNGLAVRFRQAAALGKPIIVGEFGNRLGSSGAATPADRAALFVQKVHTYFGNGAAGALIWNFVPHPGGAGSYDVGPGDPALAATFAVQ